MLFSPFSEEVKLSVRSRFGDGWPDTKHGYINFNINIHDDRQ